ncbi:MAG: hypothetical protein HKN13_08175, partial [Rhodothermales bacterium]|nr:hypothetical protein [Rhodothermales bacterium]
MKAITRTAVLLLTIVICSELPANAQPARDTTLTAPDFTSVIITRDAFGVPHISASTEVALFYGQGFAAAEDRLFQMESFRRITQGREAEIYGPSKLASDQATITLIYTDAERTAQFNALSSQLQTILTAYKDGVNAYLADVRANPTVFKPREFDTLNIPVVDYTVEDLLAIIQGFLIGFGGNGGDELTLLGELNTLGPIVFDATYPINDPTAPTTIPDGGAAAQKVWSYSGMTVDPQAARAVKELRDNALVGMPKFGSFAAIIDGAKSNSGNVMLLGAPQMGEPLQTEPSRTMEVELISPTIHVGGMTVAGAPGVIIGHNEDFAWSLTSGQSDNTDLYVEVTNVAGTQYLYNSVFQNFEVLVNSIPVMGQSNVVFNHFRTVHGPVVGSDIPNQQAFSVKTTYWGQEMAMMQGLHDIWKASTLAGFELGVAQIPMSFNVVYAGENSGSGDQTIKYWHTGKYQDRTDGVDPRLPHSGIGTEEWGGFIPFANLPQADATDQDYFVNWNNKPISSWDQGDNMPWIVGNIFRDRVNPLETYVSSTTPFTYANLQNIPTTIGDRGTYSQAIEIAPAVTAAQSSMAHKNAQAATFTDENLNPPGQSGFISIAQDTSAHFKDQWALHQAFGWKDMLYSPESLPIVLTGLRAVTSGSSVTLFWAASGEGDASQFEVQRYDDSASAAEANWRTVGFVKDDGDSFAIRSHSFRIDGLTPGFYQFRIRMIDSDGSVETSAVVTASIGTQAGNELSVVFPNPASDRAAFSVVVAESGDAVIDVYDAIGRRVLRLHEG